MASKWRSTPTIIGQTEFQRNCTNHGPMLYLFDGVKEDTLNQVCDAYLYRTVRPVLLPYTKSEPAMRRHWPWVAFAISQYEYQSRAMAEYRNDELTPSEVAALIQRIKSHADKLATELCTLQSHSYRLPVPGKPEVRGHLEWLDGLLSQAIGGRLDSDLDTSDSAILHGMTARTNFYQTLVDLSVAATLANEWRDPALLARARGGENPALPSFAKKLAAVWCSLTDRPASTNKTNGGEDPHFVEFIRAAGLLANKFPISRRMIESALKP